MSYNDYHDYIRHSEDDTLMHFAKGQTAKNHKYIKIHMSKNGKPWYEYATSYYKTVKSNLNDFGRKTGKAVNLIGRSAKDAYKTVSKKTKDTVKNIADKSGYTAKQKMKIANRKINESVNDYMNSAKIGSTVGASRNLIRTGINRKLYDEAKKEYDSSILGKTEKAISNVANASGRAAKAISSKSKELGKKAVEGIKSTSAKAVTGIKSASAKAKAATLKGLDKGIDTIDDYNRNKRFEKKYGKNNFVSNTAKGIGNFLDDTFDKYSKKENPNLSKLTNKISKTTNSAINKGKRIVKDILTKDTPQEKQMKSTKKWVDNLGKNIKKGTGSLADDAADLITDKQRQSSVSKTLSKIGLSKSQIKGVNDLLDKGDLTIDTIKKKLGLRTGDAEKVKKSILSIFNN